MFEGGRKGGRRAEQGREGLKEKQTTQAEGKDFRGPETGVVN